MPMPKPLLIGEDNPYGSDQSFALYPKPESSAGGRLCHAILGFTFARAYLNTFDRVNLCSEGWSLRAARVAAAEILKREGPKILLGAKVCRAFAVAFEPFTVTGIMSSGPLYILPHPSGRCRLWNDPRAITRAQAMLAPLLPVPR